jgi:succinyl-diaminopimelate desuccinylase
MARAVQKAKGGRPKYSVTQGFTDLHFFVNEGGMPGVGYGAAGKNIHAIDERVNIRDLVQTSKVYAHLISDWE